MNFLIILLFIGFFILSLIRSFNKGGSRGHYHSSHGFMDSDNDHNDSGSFFDGGFGGDGGDGGGGD